MTARGAVAAVRAFTRRGSEDAAARCETCGASLEERHDHVVDRRAGDARLLCACAACAVAAPTSDRVRRSARRVGGAPSARVWAALGVPVELAFFFLLSSADGAARLVARYPNQTGAIEANLPDDALSCLAEDVPEARALAADVEGLLVDRRRDAVYRVSLDVGFELCARMRGARDGAATARAFFDHLDHPAAFDVEAARG